MSPPTARQLATKNRAASSTVSRSCSELIRRLMPSYRPGCSRHPGWCGSQVGARHLQLTPQVVDMDRDRVRVRLLVDAVKLLLQHGFRHDASEPPHHLLEDRQLTAGQAGGNPADRKLAPD